MARTLGGHTVGAFSAPLVNTVLPAITGTPTVGETLTCSTGTWTGYPPPTFARQWYWADTSAAIAGATGATYLLVVGDETHTIKCTVTAINASSVSATSADTSAVAGA